MSFFKKITAVLMSAAFTVTAVYVNGYTAQAENERLVIDCSAIDEMPSKQFYYSDENEFFIDGIKVLKDGKNITSDVNFIFNTTPESTFNGKDHDYKVPFSVEYADKNGAGITVSGSMNAKIGMRGDANCDNKVNMNDVYLIENDIYMNYISGKSALTANDGLGIFLANADGRQRKISDDVFGMNDLNAADAFYISSYINGGSKGTLFDHILAMNASKPSEGTISFSNAEGTQGDLVTVYANISKAKGFGAFDFTCAWPKDVLDLVSVSSCSSNVTVFSALSGGKLRVWGFANKGFIGSGNAAELVFEIPDDVEYGDNVLTFERVDYLGSGENISDTVLVNDGIITVSDNTTGIRSNITEPVRDMKVSYDYGVKLWDAVVSYDTKSVELPVMLLGGLQTKGFTLGLTVPDGLSVTALPNAKSYSGEGGKITGVYESSSPMTPDIDVVSVSVSDGIKPGRYYIGAEITNIEGKEQDTQTAQLGGYITIKEKPILFGDANLDGKVNIRDAACIASMLSKGAGAELPKAADYNKDGTTNIRDAAAIAKMLSKKS